MSTIKTVLYYQILTTRKIPGELLTYSYEKQLNLGQLVGVLVRGKLVAGVVFDFIQEEKLSFDKKKAKSISKILPACLNQFQLDFLKLLSFNTFNSKNNLFKGFYQPFSYLTKGNWLELRQIWGLDKINVETEENLKNLKFLESKTSTEKSDSLRSKSNNSNLKNIEGEKKSDLKQNFLARDQNNILNKNEQIQNNKKKIEKPSISVKFELDSDYVVRIINLIRSQNCTKKNTSPTNILFIFPEQKLLDKTFQGVIKKFVGEKKINFYKYSNNGNKDAKYTARKIILDNFKFLEKNNLLDTVTWDLLVTIPKNPNLDYIKTQKKCIKSEKLLKNKPQNEAQKEIKNLVSDTSLTSYKPKINLFFSTRSGIFLPFLKLNQIVLLDEANSMYIQEQNSLYFDTRDAVYLMAKSYGCNLTYISSLPSLRLFQNYNKQGLLNLLNQKSYQESINFEIKTSQLNPQDKTQLLSPEVENLILGDEEYGTVTSKF